MQRENCTTKVNKNVGKILGFRQTKELTDKVHEQQIWFWSITGDSENILSRLRWDHWSLV